MQFPEQQPSVTSGRTGVHRILIFADGTCNAFGRHESNVVSLLKSVSLGRSEGDEQVAVYDQGLGSQIGQHEESLKFKSTICPTKALEVLPPPKDSLFKPWTIPSWVRAMTVGEGLAENVEQLYVALAERYRDGAEVFCFGFSRGAFTLRALAAMTWQFGVPSSNDRDQARRYFAAHWPKLEQAYVTGSRVERGVVSEPRLGPGAQTCAIRFMGLWDTVKSYGGLKPKVLPHLRHNPSVQVVRHALALDERRAWFEATTWGWLDSDREAGCKNHCQPGRCPRAALPSNTVGGSDEVAASRLDAQVVEQLRNQGVAEVWFKGSHSDIGGGNGNTATSNIALSWMLGEAHSFGLRVNKDGRKLLSVRPEDEQPVVKDSRRPMLGYVWRVIDRLHRQSISNEGKWPDLISTPPGPVARRPCKSARGGQVLVHASAMAHFTSQFASCGSMAPSARCVETHRLGASQDKCNT